jgi:hypothetical protein
MNLSEKELEPAIREVIKRSVVDAEFRTLAVKNPNAAISKASGKSVPTGTTISFISNHGSASKTYVLPDPVSNPEQLTDAALEQVAGGCTASNCGVSGADE